MNLSNLTFITSNPSKAEQLSYHLDFPITHKHIDLYEIQSLDLKEIVEQKAREAYQQVQSPVLIEDTSLIFNALGKLPGTLIKWFLCELGNEGLCKLLVSNTDRSAIAQVMFAVYDGTEMHFFDGSTEGTISDNPRGADGFGWDPIFIPKGYTKTWGEMDIEEQKNTSMRRIALKKLENFLQHE